MVTNNYVIYFGGFLSNEYDTGRDNLELIKNIKNDIKRVYKDEIIFIDPINLNKVSINKAMTLDIRSKKYADLIIYILRKDSSIYGLLDLYSMCIEESNKKIIIFSPDNMCDKIMVDNFSVLSDKFLIYSNVEDILRYIDMNLEDEEDNFAELLKTMHDMNETDDEDIEVEENVVEEIKPKKEIKKTKKAIMNERFDNLLERRGIKQPTQTTTVKKKTRAYVIGEKPPTGPASTYINIESDPTEPEPERVYDPTVYRDNFQATPSLPMQTASPKLPKSGFVESGTVGSKYRSAFGESAIPEQNIKPTKLPMATVGSTNDNNNNSSINPVSGPVKIGQMNTNGNPATPIVRVGENNSEGGAQIGRF